MKRPDIAELRIDRALPQIKPRSRLARLPWRRLGLLACLAAAAMAWWARSPIVRAAPVGYTTASQQWVMLTASGHVAAQVRAAVGSNVSGRLVELKVIEGSHVERGELIARLDTKEVDAALNNSRAGVRQAEARALQAEQERLAAIDEFNRNSALQAQGFVSTQAATNSLNRVKTAEAGVAAANADIDIARAQVGINEVSRIDSNIYAPFDGVVLVRQANVGEIISPLSGAAGAQSAVVTIADMRSLEVEADVSEGELSKVQVGQPVEIALDALPQERFRGRVDAVVPTIDRARATVKTKISFEQLDPRILPEMSARVSFLSHSISSADQRALLTVPVAALQPRQEARASVFRLRTEAAGIRVQRLDLTLGRRFGAMVEVTGSTPLREGDRLVLEPSPQLRDGALVRLQAD